LRKLESGDWESLDNEKKRAVRRGGRTVSSMVSMVPKLSRSFPGAIWGRQPLLLQRVDVRLSQGRRLWLHQKTQKQRPGVWASGRGSRKKLRGDGAKEEGKKGPKIGIFARSEKVELRKAQEGTRALEGATSEFWTPRAIQKGDRGNRARRLATKKMNPLLIRGTWAFERWPIPAVRISKNRSVRAREPQTA